MTDISASKTEFRALTGAELDDVNGGFAVAAVLVAAAVIGLAGAGVALVEEGLLAQQVAWYAAR